MNKSLIIHHYSPFERIFYSRYEKIYAYQEFFNRVIIPTHIEKFVVPNDLLKEASFRTAEYRAAQQEKSLFKNLVGNQKKLRPLLLYQF